MIKKVISLIILVSLSACVANSTADYTAIGTTKASDFIVPSFIFKNIEKRIKEEGIKAKPIYRRVEAIVALKSIDQGVLKSSSIRVTLPVSGNYLDLSKYVIGKGRFSIGFDEKLTENLPPLEAFYFLSQWPQIKTSTDIYGVGCDKIVNYFAEAGDFFSNKGVEVSTEHDQHLGLLVGDYIMAFRDKNIVYLSHVQLGANPKNVGHCNGGIAL